MFFLMVCCNKIRSAYNVWAFFDNYKNSIVIYSLYIKLAENEQDNSLNYLFYI